MIIYVITVNKNGNRINFFRKSERWLDRLTVWEAFTKQNPEMAGYAYDVDCTYNYYIQDVE